MLTFRTLETSKQDAKIQNTLETSMLKFRTPWKPQSNMLTFRTLETS